MGIIYLTEHATNYGNNDSFEQQHVVFNLVKYIISYAISDDSCTSRTYPNVVTELTLSVKTRSMTE